MTPTVERTEQLLFVPVQIMTFLPILAFNRGPKISATRYNYIPKYEPIFILYASTLSDDYMLSNLSIYLQNLRIGTMVGLVGVSTDYDDHHRRGVDKRSTFGFFPESEPDCLDSDAAVCW